MEAEPGTWRWGRGSSEDSLGGTSPGCVSGNSRRVRLGGGGAGVRPAAPMGRRSVPKGKTRGRILCFQITAGRCPCLLLLGTADQEKALAGFNLIWALGAYQVILFPPRRVLLLPALDPLSSTRSVHRVTACPLMPRPYATQYPMRY